MRILIIHSDRNIRNMFRALFKSACSSFEVFCASTWEHAEDMYGRDDWDVMLCDHHTDGINSQTVWKRLRNTPSQPKRFYAISDDSSMRPVEGMSGVLANYESAKVSQIAMSLCRAA